MKKLLMVAALAALMLAAFTVPAAAQDDTLTDLAGYFYDDAPVFATFRTDADFVQTLDGLLEKIAALSPDGGMNESLEDALDELASEFGAGNTFDETFRTWMGDSAAFGAYTLEETGPVPPLTVVIPVTDQDAAEAFFAVLPNAERYEISEGDGYTLYTPADNFTSDPYFIFRSDVVIMTGDGRLVEAGGVVDSPLSGNPDFTEAVDLLPSESYDAIAYADIPAIYGKVFEDSSAFGSTSEATATMNMLQGLLGAVKPQAYGFTLDGRSLIFDAAAPVDAEAAGGFNLATMGEPIDPAFASRIPAGVPFVIHGSNLYQSFQAALDNWQLMAETMSDDGVDTQEFQTMLFALEFGVRGLTGMDVEDALGWMTGDFAFAFGFTPSFSDSPNFDDDPESFPFDLSFVIDAGDGEGAQAFFDGMAESMGDLTSEEMSIETETLDGGVEALVITLDVDDIDVPIELLIANGNGVFAFGTRRMVMAAINPQNGLDADPAFVEASATMLADPISVLFLGSEGLQPIARGLMASESSRDQADGEQFGAILDLISSVSISSSLLPDNGGSLTRFVWTLPE